MSILGETSVAIQTTVEKARTALFNETREACVTSQSAIKVCLELLPTRADHSALKTP